MIQYKNKRFFNNECDKSREKYEIIILNYTIHMIHEQNTASLFVRSQECENMCFFFKSYYVKRNRESFSLVWGCSNFIKIIYADISKRYLASTANPLYQD